MVESQVRNKIKYILLRVCEIKCQKLFGFIPDDMSLAFKPLRMLSAEQEENVKTQKFARLQQAKAAGDLTTLEFRDACNKGNLFDVILDTDQSIIGEGGFQDDTVSEGANNPKNPKDLDNPGADRLDTRKSRATEVGGIGKEPVPPKSSDAPEVKAKAKDPAMSNSPAFDKASFEAEGGDSIYDPARVKALVLLKNGALWEEAKKASKASYGEIKWPFVMWMYEKLGGKL
jgi:hypothetical protein